MNLRLLLGSIASLLLAVGVAAAQSPSQPPAVIHSEVDVHAPGKNTEPARASTPFRVGVVPSLGANAKTESDQLATFLSKALERRVVAALFANHDALANALVDGRIDFAWMPPLQAFNAQLGGATLVAKLTRQGAASYRSVLFVRADSKLKGLTDVKSAKVGWVEANSATGHLFPLAMIAKAHLTPAALFSSEIYLGDHDAVCKAVWGKQVDLGATLADEPAAGKPLEVTGCKHILGKKAAQLRVLAESEPVPNDVIAVRKGMDPATRDAVQKIALALPDSKEGKVILREVLKADGVVAVRPGDLDPVQRALEAASGVEEPPAASK